MATSRMVAGARAARRLLLRDPGHLGRRLAHRVGAAADAGRDGGGLPARLSHRDHGRECGRAVDRGATTAGRSRTRRWRCFACVGIVTTLLIPEPRASRGAGVAAAGAARASPGSSASAHWPQAARDLGSWFVGAVVCPFIDFFTRYGTAARGADAGLHRELPARRFHDGRDDEPVLHRPRVLAEADRRDRQGLRRVHVDARHAARRRRGRAAGHGALARARQRAGHRRQPDVRGVRALRTSRASRASPSSSARTTSRWAWRARR